MKKLLAATLIGASLLATGCATSGNKVLKEETRETVAQKISPGMSQSDITGIFGEPVDIDYTDSGNEIWKYKFSKTKVKASSFIPVVGYFNSGSTGDAKSLTIFFDPNGKVVRHAMTSSDIDTNTSLIQ